MDVASAGVAALLFGKAAGCAQAVSITQPNNAAQTCRRAVLVRHSNEGVKTGMQRSKRQSSFIAEPPQFAR